MIEEVRDSVFYREILFQKLLDDFGQPHERQYIKSKLSEEEIDYVLRSPEIDEVPPYPSESIEEEISTVKEYMPMLAAALIITGFLSILIL